VKKLYQFFLLFGLGSQLVSAATFMVSKGDTLSHIAQTHLGQPIYSDHGTLKKLIILNPQIQNIHFIKPGQIVYLEDQTEASVEVAEVPGPDSTPEVVAETANEYRVKRGDTFSELAAEFEGRPIYRKDGSLRKLAALNPQIKNLNFIKPGEVIFLGVHTQGVADIEKVETIEPTGPIAEVAPVLDLTIPPREVAAPESAEFSPYSRLGVSTGFEYFSINATDKSTKDTARVVSAPSPTINAYWALQWSEKYSTRLNIGYIAETLLKDRSTDKKLINPSGSRTNFGFDLVRHVSDKFRVKALASYSRRAFLRSESINSVRVDRINGLEVGGGADYDFLKKGSASMGVGLQASFLAPAQGPGYSTQAGYAGMGSLYLRHQLRKAMLEASTYYGYWNQDSKYVSQSVNSVGVNFGLSWSFDE
jgi:LysM repeat protein